MTPSLVTFSEFLLDRHPSFKTLQGVKVLTKNNVPIISCTSQFAEAHIELNGKEYILALPLNGTIPTPLERTCSVLNKLCTSALMEYRLLKGEISLSDSMGQLGAFDVILHALPEGESLDKAVMFVATKRLRAAVSLLKQEMSKIGFLHGNLKPSNLIYGTDGHLYPIRYNYARLGAEQSHIAAEWLRIEEFLDGVAEVAEIGEYTSPTEYDKLLPYDEVFPLQDTMRRVRNGELYGYLDNDNVLVIEPQFTYAENFFENRAVVQTTDGKMGVIDHDFHWIIEPIYDMVGFEDGVFSVRKGHKWFRLNYVGEFINNK